MSISGLKGGMEAQISPVWIFNHGTQKRWDDILVIVDEKTLHDEDVDSFLLHIGLTRLRWQADAVGAGELDRVLLPSSHRVDHRLHVQGIDHWDRTGEKREKPGFTIQATTAAQWAATHTHKSLLWNVCSILWFYDWKITNLGLIGYQTRKKNMQERENTLLQGFPTWNPILPSHCLKPSSPTSIWSGLWNNSHQ